MKKHFILLMLLGVAAILTAAQGSIVLSGMPNSVQLTSERQDGLSVSYHIEKLNYNEVDTPQGRFTDLYIDHYTTTNQEGMPRLPLQRQLIAVPEGATVIPSIISAQRQTINLSSRSVFYPILPRQESVAKCDNPEDLPFVVNRDFYNRSAWTDHQSISVHDLGYMRGVHIYALDFVPVKYNPAAGQIEVIHSAEVKVDFVGADHAATQSLREKYYSDAFNGIFQKSLLNPVDTRATLNRHPMSYLIITPPSFVGALAPFVDWKTREGFNVITATTDQTGSTAASIKNYIQNLWNSATAENPAPSYLLIVGDVAQVPSNTGATGSHVTDLTYVRLQGSDYLPEMYFSRFSATAPAEVTNQVNKTLMHEKYTMPSDEYLAKSVLIAGVDSSWSTTHANGAINYATNNYFNTAHGITSHTYLYPASGSSASQIVQKVSEGAGFVNYTAHGSETSWADPSFTISNVNSLQNTNKYPVVVGNCCVTNAFNTGICFGEAWLRAVDKGAVIYIGGTNNTYWDEDYWWAVGYKPPVVGSGSPFVAGRTGNYDALFHEHNEPYEDWSNSVGATVFMGNMAVQQSNSTRTNYYWEVYSIMGDASLIPYLGIPTPITAQYPETLFLGLGTMEITADPYTYVAISMDGVLHGAGLVGANGTLTLNYTPFEMPGTAQIVMTRSLHKPLIANLQVIPNQGPYVTVSPITVNDPNANGLAEAGEIISFNLSFNNVGVTDATNLTATITSESPWVNILTASSAVPNVPAGGTVSANGLFSVQISPMVPDQLNIPFELSITDGTHTWTSIRSITSYAAKLEVAQVTIQDTNGNGFYEAGETITIRYLLANFGHMPISGGSMLLIPNHPGAVLTNTEFDLPPLAIGASTPITAIVILSPSIATGTVINLGAAINAGVQLINHSITLPIGMIGEGFESGNFNSFAWENNSATPWIVQNANVHGGSYAARSGAIGHNTYTALSISMPSASAGSIRFWRKVSSESGYDGLRFYINNTEMGFWSGNQDWAEVSFPTAAGTNTYKWEYRKDYSVSSGSDCAWIDDIVFPFTGNAEAAIFYTPTQALNYANVSPGNVLTKDLIIRNLGNTAMHGMITVPAGFILMQGSNILPSEYSYDIESEDNGVFTVKYIAPNPVVSFQDVIIVSSSDPNNPAVMIPISVQSSSSNDDPILPAVTRLQGNYPNPFNPSTTISFAIHQPGNVSLNIYNLKGQLVKRLVDAQLDAGNHKVIWNGKDEAGRSVASGIYMYRMEAPGYAKTLKMMLMK